VEGRDLAEAVRDGPLTPSRAATLMREVAGAIHYAHGRGILHRDLKPSNVLLEREDRPRVTDFGLAKHLPNSEIETQRTELTLSGQVLGSPSFMPPEQAAARNTELGPRSDLYSLGAMLYHMLTGRPPFVAENVAATLRLVAENEPIPPRLLAPVVPADLETICLKCLEKDPSRRYASAQQLADELGRFLRSEPIQARPLGSWGRLNRWRRRHPGTAALTGTIGLLLIAVAVISTTAAARLRKANHEGKEKLRAAYLAQARASGRGGQEGQRFTSLEALRKAAEIRPGPDLRNEAIACMTRPDVRPVKVIDRNGYDFIAFDAQYQRYARAADGAGKVSIHRLSDDSELASLMVTGASRRVTHFLRFSPDGALIAAHFTRQTSSPPKVLVWDLARAEVILEIVPRSGDIVRCDFSPDSRQIAFAQTKGPVLVYEKGTPEPVHTIEVRPGASAICFDPTGKKLAVSRYNASTLARATNSNVEIWDLKTGRIKTLPHADLVEALDWHRDAQLLATACSDSHVRVWDTATGEQRALLVGHQSSVLSVQFSARGNHLFTFGNDATLRVWDWFNGRPLLTKDAINCYARLSSGGNRLGCGLPEENKIAVLDVMAEREWQMLRIEDDSASRNDLEAVYLPSAGTLSATNNLFATAHHNGVRLWDLASARHVAHLSDRGYSGATVHSNGRLLFTTGGGDLKVWPIDATENENNLRLQLGPAEVLQTGRWTGPICFSADGRTLAAGHWTNVTLLDLGSRREKVRVPASSPANLSYCLSPNGKWVAISGWTGPVQVFDARVGALHHSLPRDSNLERNPGAGSHGTLHLLFSPDSRWLVVGTRSSIAFWDTATWKMVRFITRSTTGINPGVTAFTADSKVVAASVSKDSLRLLATESGKELASLESPSPRLPSAIAFTHDGSRLAVICGERGLEVWNLHEIRQQLASMELDWEAGPGGLEDSIQR